SLPQLTASFTAAGCTNAFGIETCTAQAGQSVSMTSTSTGDPTGYAWSFGDGAVATGTAVTHTWATAGTYTVELDTTRDADKSNASTRKTFVVTPAPLGKAVVL